MKTLCLFFSFLILMVSSACQASSYGLGYDYPVGWPNASGYYDAQGFGVWNSSFGGYHLGEDWNGKGGGDSDLGDPIYSISEGEVTLVANRRVWGNVVIIKYENRVNALFAHLKDVDVKQGQKVSRGFKIGTMGKGDKNVFASHLHFEVRDNLSIGIGSGYGGYKPSGWVDPSAFIKANRPKPPVVAQNLTAESNSDGVNLTWNQNTSGDFLKFEIYRSETQGGTKNSTTRTLVTTISEQVTVNYSDKTKLTFEKDYYYAIATFEKDGRSAISNEVVINKKREVIILTDDEFDQDFPVVQGKYVVWQDGEREQTAFPQRTKMNYYNLETKEEKTIEIGNILNRLEGPYAPTVYEDMFCYSAKTSYYGKQNIYCHDIKKGYDLPITNDTSNNNYNPQISSIGIVVWQKKVGTQLKIYGLDLNKAEGEKLLVDANYNQNGVDLDGSKMIWKDSRVGNRYDLYMKDLAGGEEILLATNVGSGAADISGNYVTWFYKEAVYLLNIVTMETKQICASGCNTVNVYSDKLVYQKEHADGFGYFHVLQISSGKETIIDFPLKYFSQTCLYEDVFVFTAPSPKGLAETHMDIFLTYL